MSDVVGSIWEDDERVVGKGRYFLVLAAEASFDDPTILVVTIRDIDHETDVTQRIDYSVRYECFPWLENLQRIM